MEGKPYIDKLGDFQLAKEPGKCGYLADEIEDQTAGDPAVAVVRDLMKKKPKATVEETIDVLRAGGFPHSEAQAKRYRRAAKSGVATAPEEQQEDMDFVGQVKEDM